MKNLKKHFLINLKKVKLDEIEARKPTETVAET